MSGLTAKKCVPCEGGIPPLEVTDVQRLMAELKNGWAVVENKKLSIPAVVHEDGTCRIQTVNFNQNSDFYNLISEFYRLTGVPMLLNTSLNNGGKPISGHPDRSLTLLNNSEMDALCIGNKIYT